MIDLTQPSPRYRSGNIVNDDAGILVNTVNTVGIMGKGVALAFKQRWPGIMPDYIDACRSGRLRPGGCLLLPLPDGRLWAALATKAHWRNPSSLEWIRTGLDELSQLAGSSASKSIAIPPPGCGLGGLEWMDVKPLVLGALGRFDLRIYGRPPQST